MKVSNAKSVDEFVVEAPLAACRVLEHIRKLVKQAVPEVDETMGYGKPYYKYYGWMTGVKLSTKFLGVEIWDSLSDKVSQKLDALGYKTGSKNLQIRYNQEVPVELFTRLVKAQAK